MDSGSFAAGGLRGVVGAMGMTGFRTLAAEFGLLEHGTPPDQVADAAPAVLRAVPVSRRSGLVDVMHLSFGALGGVVFAALPKRVRRHWASGPVFGMSLWAGYYAGIVPLFGLHAELRRRPHEVAILAADHALYGLIVARLGGQPD